MNQMCLDEGQKIRVTSFKRNGSYVVLENVNGNIVNRTGSDRDN
jgi:hypothetical protein